MLSDLVKRVVPLYYEVPKQVRFYDRRLVSLQGLILVGVALVYSLGYQILYNHEHYVFEKPVGTVVSWGATWNTTNVDDSFCNNPDFDGLFFPTTFGGANVRYSNLSFTDIGCVPFESYSDMATGTDSLRVVTARVTYPAAYDADPSEFDAKYIQGLETVTFNLDRNFQVSWMETGVTNPKTDVREQNGDILFSTNEGETIYGFRMADLFRIAGLDLGEINSQPLFDHSPRRRYTGAIVLVTLNYKNVSPWSIYSSNLCTVTAEVLPGLWGSAAEQVTVQNDTTIVSTDLIVEVKFLTNGEIGHFKFFNLILVFMQMTALIGLAQYFVLEFGHHLIEDERHQQIFQDAPVEVGYDSRKEEDGSGDDSTPKFVELGETTTITEERRGEGAAGTPETAGAATTHSRIRLSDCERSLREHPPKL